MMLFITVKCHQVRIYPLSLKTENATRIWQMYDLMQPINMYYQNILLLNCLILAEKVPSYARDTLASRQHTRDDLFLSVLSPPPFTQRSKSDIGSLVSEEPLDTERKDEAYLVCFVCCFSINNTKLCQNHLHVSQV